MRGWRSFYTTILVTINRARSWSAHLDTKPSQTLAKRDVNEIGLSLDIVAGDSLGMGAIVASFHTWGTTPSLKDELNISVTGMLSSQANSLINLPGSPSGPAALRAFNFLNASYISQTCIWGGGLAGRKAGSSSRLTGGLLCETEANLSLIASAISFSSHWSIPGTEMIGRFWLLFVINWIPLCHPAGSVDLRFWRRFL